LKCKFKYYLACSKETEKEESSHQSISSNHSNKASIHSTPSPGAKAELLWAIPKWVVSTVPPDADIYFIFPKNVSLFIDAICAIN
jgi:hypothetical protein